MDHGGRRKKNWCVSSRLRSPAVCPIPGNVTHAEFFLGWGKASCTILGTGFSTDQRYKIRASGMVVGALSSRNESFQCSCALGARRRQENDR